MYNGVGIVTPRGSGTSGYVQKNAATVRHKVDYAARRKEEAKKAVVLPNDPELVEHERKREVELKVQLWAREHDIRKKHDKAKAAELIRQKRKEVELELGLAEEGEVPKGKEDNDARSKKRHKE